MIQILRPPGQPFVRVHENLLAYLDPIHPGIFPDRTEVVHTDVSGRACHDYIRPKR